MTEENQTDDIKPWTIKNIPEDLRTATKTRAKLRKMDLGSYVSLALTNQIKAENNESKGLTVVDSKPKKVELNTIKEAVEVLGLMKSMGLEPPKHIQQKVVTALGNALKGT